MAQKIKDISRNSEIDIWTFTYVYGINISVPHKTSQFKAEFLECHKQTS